jgi:hypothetical protein
MNRGQDNDNEGTKRIPKTTPARGSKDVGGISPMTEGCHRLVEAEFYPGINPLDVRLVGLQSDKPNTVVHFPGGGVVMGHI